MRALLCLLLLFSFSPAQAASLQASLDRNPISIQETVTLTVQAEEADPDGSPDFSGLEQDFEILSTSRSTQIQASFTSSTKVTQWQLILAPKRDGELRIPAFTIDGLRSQALTLKVLSGQEAQAQGRQTELFMEAEILTPNPYVQSQVTYVLRLFSRYQILSGSLSEIQVPRLSAQTLGDNRSYTAQRDGVQYHVIEQRYALIPEASGELEIPPVTFQGQIAAPQARRRSGLNDPFFDNFFANRQGKTVRARSPAVRFSVQAKADEFPANTAWLAAHDLYLSESWTPEPPTFRVGEPVTRSLTLQAQGLLGAQLPELQPAASEGLKAYPDQAQVDTSVGGDWLVGQRKEKIALVPTRPGTLQLPEIRLPWWNTQKQSVEYVSLPARTVEVLPAANAPTPAAPAPTAAPDATDSAPADSSAPVIKTVPDAGFWPWLSALLGAGWLLTLAAWFWHSRRPRAAKPASIQATNSPRAALRSIEQACKSGDPAAARQALLDWGKRHWPQQPLTGLDSLAQRWREPRIQESLQALDRALYSPAGTAQWNGAACWDVLRPALHAAADKRDSSPEPGLAPLYPL